MPKKYEFVHSDTKIYSDQITLTRIRALVDIPGVVCAGDLGGYLEHERNLSHEGHCWVGDDAMVFQRAKVYDHAVVRDQASVSGSATIRESACVTGNAWVHGRAVVNECACVMGSSEVDGDTKVSGHACVSGNAKVTDTATICDYAAAAGDSVVSGDACIEDNAIVDGEALVSGDIRVCGRAHLRANAIVSKMGDYLTIGPFDEENEGVSIYLDSERGVTVGYGGFSGSVDEFLESQESSALASKGFPIALVTPLVSSYFHGNRRQPAVRPTDAQ